MKNLTMRNEAQIKIEAWSPSTGAKGTLQTAWFRVSNIPADQRSIRTLAKVGGLVGKVIEIDEGSRYRYDYVRMKIACRDVTRVPRTAEGTLGLQLIDFEYERELYDDNGTKVLKSGIVVTEDQQPPAKRTKADTSFISSANDGGSGKADKQGTSHGTGKQADTGKQVDEVFWSAPLR